jgi:hypothetical protein
LSHRHQNTESSTVPTCRPCKMKANTAIAYKSTVCTQHSSCPPALLLLSTRLQNKQELGHAVRQTNKLQLIVDCNWPLSLLLCHLTSTCSGLMAPPRFHALATHLDQQSHGSWHSGVLSLSDNLYRPSPTGQHVFQPKCCVPTSRA